ncbi:hypothetical protein GGR96_001698 [Thalassospira tepidiphila]|uniref:Uncharacterized protein n=2 Tax=Thalassospira tepidiphila TaxID=393657 RepID=A0A853KVR0_9PROT|nr:hypothetical protein [Thalassospira tepidiphila]OAZ08065.1 hypothetical protein TH4_18600 [Thalassospira tepidiphila MCCC 1A03514]
MINFGAKISAGSVREVISEMCGHPASKLLILLRKVKVREVFAGCLREVREVGSQVIDIAAGSLRAGSPYRYSIYTRWLFGSRHRFESGVGIDPQTHSKTPSKPRLLPHGHAPQSDTERKLG